MQAVYLAGDQVYLRALVEGDKEHATAWFDSPYPINATRAQAFFDDLSATPWLDQRIHLVIARTSNDAIVGGANMRVAKSRLTTLRFHMAPALDDADELRAEALRLLVRWLRDEHEMMVVTAEIGADEPATLAAAHDLGMVEGVRLREHLARPGGRADLLYCQALNPSWEVRDA